MLYKLLQSFNVDVVITAICMGDQCFISASVCLFLIKNLNPYPSVVCLFGITYWV